MLGSFISTLPVNELKIIMTTHFYSVIRQVKEKSLCSAQKTVANNLFAVQHNSMTEHLMAQIH